MNQKNLISLDEICFVSENTANYVNKKFDEDFQIEMSSTILDMIAHKAHRISNGKEILSYIRADFEDKDYLEHGVRMGVIEKFPVNSMSIDKYLRSLSNDIYNLVVERGFESDWGHLITLKDEGVYTKRVQMVLGSRTE